MRRMAWKNTRQWWGKSPHHCAIFLLLLHHCVVSLPHHCLLFLWHDPHMTRHIFSKPEKNPGNDEANGMGKIKDNDEAICLVVVWYFCWLWENASFCHMWVMLHVTCMDYHAPVPTPRTGNPLQSKLLFPMESTPIDLIDFPQIESLHCRHGATNLGIHYNLN